MQDESLHIPEEHKSSHLYSEELAPVPASGRTWNKWSLAAIWVGMAVCIPTYILASYMIRSGLSWTAALIIIGLANLVITVPMVLNGNAGVKYGIPFPVIGRASFGISGIHVASIVRAIVACGWFGVQTWIGGLAIYSIWQVIAGEPITTGLDTGKFIAFGVFWLMNIYFIWKGTESIRWLENYSAPILILIGLILIAWAYRHAGGFGAVLAQGEQLQKTTAMVQAGNHADEIKLTLNPLQDKNGNVKASSYSILLPTEQGYYDLGWETWSDARREIIVPSVEGMNVPAVLKGGESVKVQFRNSDGAVSTFVNAIPATNNTGPGIWEYILWFTAMVGFWATMSISISDITRYARSQKDQVVGQFIGLPGTMIFYSFVGIFVTCAAIIAFKDILVAEDAPWDPVSLVARFQHPAVVIFAQVAMLIATLSTNIAANVIAPANAFSNLFPKRISFRAGGVIAGIIGILICPWWLMDEISGILIFVSGLLGPVLGILLCDYFIIRKRNIQVAELYRPGGIYSFGGSGFNPAAMWALFAGVLIALAGYWIPAINFLYKLSWFTGFLVSFVVYYVAMGRSGSNLSNT